MTSLRRGWVLLAMLVAQTALAVGVTPEVLDLERNPVLTLAAAEKGLAELPAPPPQGRERRLALSLQAAVATLMLGDRKGFERHLAVARDLSQSMNDAYGQALCKALEAGAAGESGQPQQAVAGAREALRMAERIADPLSRVFVGDMAAWALLAGRRYAEAEPHLRAAIEAYKAQGAVLRQATTQAGMGSLYDGLRDTQSGYRERQAAHDLIRDLDAPYLKAYLNWSLGRDSLLAANPAKARVHFEAAVRESQRLNDTAGVEAAAQQGLGIAAADSGDWAEAWRRLTEVQPVLEKRGYVELWVLGQAALARAQVELGHGDGQAALNLARAKVAKLADGNGKLQFLEREAAVMRAIGEPARAAELLAEVLALERRLMADSRQSQLSELLVRYDVYKKQVENAELRLRNELAQARLAEQGTRQQLLVAVLGLGTLVLGLLGFTLFNQVRSRRHFSALALTDALTGAPNRRAILDHLGSVLASGVPGVACMLDIDHFKRINDEHGHPVGDQVLRAFYEACRAGHGEHERVGRLGGEEWLLVVTQADARAVPALFARIRQHFVRAPIGPLTAERMPSFSMGACALRPGLTVSEMLAEADAALYQAKAQGRDRVVVAPPARELPAALGELADPLAAARR